MYTGKFFGIMRRRCVSPLAELHPVLQLLLAPVSLVLLSLLPPPLQPDSILFLLAILGWFGTWRFRIRGLFVSLLLLLLYFFCQALFVRTHVFFWEVMGGSSLALISVLAFLSMEELRIHFSALAKGKGEPFGTPKKKKHESALLKEICRKMRTLLKNGMRALGLFREELPSGDVPSKNRDAVSGFSKEMSDEKKGGSSPQEDTLLALQKLEGDRGDLKKAYARSAEERGVLKKEIDRIERRLEEAAVKQRATLLDEREVNRRNLQVVEKRLGGVKSSLFEVEREIFFLKKGMREG